MAAGLFRLHLLPDACPTGLNNIAGVEAAGSDADKIQPLFITVDPPGYWRRR
jgi:hypothetical protein